MFMSKAVLNPRRAVAYVRASTMIQENTAEVQRIAIEAWALKEGIEIVEWVEDIGVSGSAPIPKRPGLIRALALLRPSDAGVLVFAERTRIARDVLVAKLIEQAARNVGAVVLTADGLTGDDPHQKLIGTILDAVSEYERDIIRGRIQAAMDSKRAKGERIGQIPFGQRLSGDGKTLEPDPEEQEIIAKVRALRAQGLSQRAIVAALEQARTPNPRTGRPEWHKTQVAKMLQKC